MYRLFIILLMMIYVAGCAPKLATKKTTEDYTEDVSAFRPKIESVETETVNGSNTITEKRPYVPPTHDINREMASIMDSIIVHNQDKMYLYTIQVYIGRSREEANQVREKVYRVLPEEKPILSYRQPSWIVTVGKYLDRVEAYKTLIILRKSYSGAMLVPARNSME
ncbi:MAG: SPOR domain-containing protein [Cyclobacteriaceae bacterium]|nr:SPOR domain-containing protein [Cyclobacteriaceae bacterium]